MFLVVIAGFFRLAVPNIVEIFQRAADATAQRDFERLKFHIRRPIASAPEGGPMVILHQDSRAALPAPLSGVQLEEGVQVNYAIRMKFPPFIDLTALEVMHEDGKHLFRLLEINDKGMEQIVRRRGPA